MVWPASRLCSVTRFDHDDFQSVKQHPFTSPVHDQHDWTAPSIPGPRPAAPHPGQSRITTGVCAAPRDNAQPTVANHRSPPATRHAHSNPPGPLIKLCPSHPPNRVTPPAPNQAVSPRSGAPHQSPPRQLRTTLPDYPSRTKIITKQYRTESGHPTSPQPSCVPPIRGTPPVTAPTAPHHIARLSLSHKNNNQAIPHGNIKATNSKIPRIKEKQHDERASTEGSFPQKVSSQGKLVDELSKEISTFLTSVITTVPWKPTY